MTEDIEFSTEPKSFLHDRWVNAAKVGQIVQVYGQPKILTQEAIISSLGTWKNGSIIDDHTTVRAGFKIYDDKFEEPFLCFLLDAHTVDCLGNSAGGSIDASDVKVSEDKLTKMTGIGYSILRKGLVPACPPEAGCGIMAAAEPRKAPLETKWDLNKADYTQEQLERACAWVDTSKPKEERTKEDCKLAYKLPNGDIVLAGVYAAMAASNGARTPVNIHKRDREKVYKVLKVAYKLFDKQPPELKAESKGGDKEIMDEEKVDQKEVRYSTVQLDERITAAVTAATEIANNAHKVELADIETVHTDALKLEEEKHKKELEDKQAGMFEHAVLLEKTRQMLGLTEEAFDKMKAAKTPDDILTLVTSLNIKKEADVAASAKKGEKDEEGDTGIVVGSASGKEKETVPTLGSWDPVKGAFNIINVEVS
jgi:hypothetical protein